MLDGVMLLWFVLAAISLLFVVVDIRTTPASPVLKWGFILLTAYTGPVGAFLYVLGCREPLPGLHERYVRHAGDRFWVRPCIVWPAMAWESWRARSSPVYFIYPKLQILRWSTPWVSASDGVSSNLCSCGTWQVVRICVRSPALSSRSCCL